MKHQKPKTKHQRNTKLQISKDASRRFWSLEFGVLLVFGVWCLVFALAGCSFAPKYERPTVETPPAYKELAPASADATNIWKMAVPNDAAIRGKWWEMFNNAELNALEDQVAVSNQNVVAAFANFLSARAIVKEAHAQLFPTLTTVPDVTRSRASVNTHGGGSSGGANSPSFTGTRYSLPLEASWEPDFWGKVRDTVKANAMEAEATAADLENTRLAAQAELAADYFQLRSQDSLSQLFADTVSAYRGSLELTKVRYNTGIASDEDVAQAETQLATAEANATNVEILRAQLEHAIAMLIGKPAARVSIRVEPLKEAPPPTPFGVPSQLLERRPDIAAAERRVAEANQRIGVAKAAFFPTITLSAQGGLQSVATENLVDWSSRFWSIGANLSETIFDAGLRRATVLQFRADYENTVAKYRQAVLTAFQQVEDDLSSLRILARQIQQQEVAVQSSQRYLDLANARYKLGIDSYLNVITAQAVYLNNRQTLVNLRSQQMVASVHLVQNVGGGWDASQLPSQKQLLSSKPQPSVK
ncbi:MAG: RND transporter [Verrucomicrobia bacterium]|nr:MAG: RND transporter [Verrucomicrobiota bacterium]